MKKIKYDIRCYLCSAICGIFGAIGFILLIYNNIIGIIVMSIIILAALVLNVLFIKI